MLVDGLWIAKLATQTNRSNILLPVRLNCDRNAKRDQSENFLFALEGRKYTWVRATAGIQITSKRILCARHVDRSVGQLSSREQTLLDRGIERADSPILYSTHNEQRYLYQRVLSISLSPSLRFIGIDPLFSFQRLSFFSFRSIFSFSDRNLYYSPM